MSWEVGLTVLATFAGDGKRYRAKILKVISQSQVQVEYIGYGGETATVHPRDLSPFKSTDHRSDESISRLLSSILRHRAIELGLQVRADGFVSVDSLLALRCMQGVSIADLKQIVSSNQKQRFSIIEEESGRLLIRANQGHSSSVGSALDDEKMLERLERADQIPICVHGTYEKHLPSIMRQGLNKMSRLHVHFSSKLFGSKDIISGMRASSEIFIHIDVERAMNDGLKFYKSSNDVILCDGVGGIISPRYFSKIERRLPNGSMVPVELPKSQSPDYLFVLDFEATCDSSRGFFPQEIIEFPVIVLSGRTGTEVCRFHRYVRPVINPILTPFCTELTGITQASVDAAAPFVTVFSELTEFLQAGGFIDAQWAPLKSFVWITCGDWDLKTMLPLQCRLSHIQVPPALSAWCNIKFVLDEVVANAKPRSMHDVLRAVELEPVGRHHSGLDDSVNIGRACTALLGRGLLFHNTGHKPPDQRK